MSVRVKIIVARGTLIVGELVILALTFWGSWLVINPPASVPVLIETLVTGLFIGVTGAAVVATAGVLLLRRLHKTEKEGEQ